MKTNKGFTLIELLVVIAIIGILSSVVLASLNTARSKGQDAAAKANLNGARAQAELFYDDNDNSYDDGTTNVCDATNGIVNAIAGADDATGNTTVCNPADQAWAASVPLVADSGEFYCVDSTGNATQTETALSTNTVCPTS